MATAYDTWLEGDCGVDDAAQARADQADFDFRTDDAKVRAYIAEASAMDPGCEPGIDALMAVYEAERCGMFAVLCEGRPLNVIQSEALCRLRTAAKAWYAPAEAEIDREIDRELEKAA